MAALTPLVLPLASAASTDEKIIGGKAGKLAKLIQAGYRVPTGFVIAIQAYQEFVRHNRLDQMIQFELGRKPFQTMRWEEIWDAALRIRTAFGTGKITLEIETDIRRAWQEVGSDKKFAVRSSAPKEDSARASFAGLHESYVGIAGWDELLRAIRLVWASLWSDAALLYQQELGLAPLHSAMAVVVQELVTESVSGVAFGCDPRDPAADIAIIEAVPGLCRDLVDGALDPDHWTLKRSTGALLEFRPGQRDSSDSAPVLLAGTEVDRLYQTLRGIESLFTWQPDLEWTGRGDRLILLQARPITTAQPPPDDKAYYLSLRPNERRLKKLAARVSGELIPQLEQEGERMAAENLADLSAAELAGAIQDRQTALIKWKQIYKQDFIPFAHGVRHLAQYYNDAVQPADAYEFVGLLKGLSMRATERNRRLLALARQLQSEPALLQTLSQFDLHSSNAETWDNLRLTLSSSAADAQFLAAFATFLDEFMDIAFDQERLSHQPQIVLQTIVTLAQSERGSQAPVSQAEADLAAALERKLLDAVGPQRRAEAEEVLRIGRLSWRLRDDDNLLLGRIESQLLRALEVAGERLRTEHRLSSVDKISIQAADIIAAALTDAVKSPVTLPAESSPAHQSPGRPPGLKPRQLIGQPAAPGLSSGLVRCVKEFADLGKFCAGEVLVCDAIQPNMTHLVPLASAIIERRGGMLIHGAIIARELGIPCVNGVPGVMEVLTDGDWVTVDGHLGIVTVGAPEFDLEGMSHEDRK